MMIVVAARGAEDPRSSIAAHLLGALHAMGHETWAFDYTAVDDATLRNKQWRWLMTNIDAEKALVVDDSAFSAIATQLVNAAAKVGIERVKATAPPLVHPAIMHSGAPVRPHFVPRAVTVCADNDQHVIDLATQLLGRVDFAVRGEGWLTEISNTALIGRLLGPIDYATLGSELQTTDVVVVPKTTNNSLISATQRCLDALSAGVPVIAFRDSDAAANLTSGDASHDNFTQDELMFVDSVDELIVELQRRNNQPVSKKTTTGFELSQRWQAETWLTETLHIEREVRNEANAQSEAQDKPRVSFVSAAYSIENYIGPMVESCLSQSVQDIEVIVTNDGSTDKTGAVLQQFADDPRVHIVNQENIGQTGRIDWVFQQSTRRARGEFIAVIGGDDTNRVDRIARQLELFDADDSIDMIHTGGSLIDREGTVLSQVFALDIPYNSTNFLRRNMISCAVASPTVTLKRSTFERFGQWAGTFPHDYLLNIRLARSANNRYLPEALVNYRMHDSNISIGSGLDRAIEEGRTLRNAELSRTALADLYPTLQTIDTVTDRIAAACHLDLGTITSVGLADAELSNKFFDLALTLEPGLAPTIATNRAIAYNLAGDAAAAQLVLEQAGVNKSASAIGISDAVFGADVEPVLNVANTSAANTAIGWDSSPASLRRILVCVDWHVAQRTSDLLRIYLEMFSPSDEVELAFMTNSFDQQDAVNALMTVMPAGVDLADSPRLTIEQWDTPFFISTPHFFHVFDLTQVVQPSKNEITEVLQRLKEQLP